MKLVPVILTFMGSSVVFSCKDSEHSVTLSAKESGLQTLVQPSKFNDPDNEDEVPDELENAIGAACILAPDISLMFEATDPSVINRQRIGISTLQEQLERGKVKYPQATEHMLLVQLIAIATGMNPKLVHAMGLAHKEVESVATPAEQALKDALARGENVSASANEVADVVLDYEPAQPPLTEADRALLESAEVALKH